MYAYYTGIKKSYIDQQYTVDSDNKDYLCKYDVAVSTEEWA